MEITDNNSTITQVLEDFGNEIQKGLQSNLGKGKFKRGLASGELFQSIKFSAKIMGSKFHFQLEMADYWEAVDKGRKAGKRPPIDTLVKWVNTKAAFGGFSNVKNIKNISVQRGLAYVIARKIGKKGTKGNKFYSKVVTPDRLKQLQKDLTRASAKDIQIVLTKTAKGILTGNSIK